MAEKRNSSSRMEMGKKHQPLIVRRTEKNMNTSNGLQDRDGEIRKQPWGAAQNDRE